MQTPPLESQAPVEPGPVQAGTGVDVGAGYLLFPPDGWTVVGGEDGLTVFQKNGVLLIAGGFPWADTAAALAVVYRDGWFTAGQFTGDEPRAGSIGNGIPAATLDYTGVVNAAQVDGAIVTGSIDGSGLILNIFGSAGTLGGIGSEFDAIPRPSSTREAEVTAQPVPATPDTPRGTRLGLAAVLIAAGVGAHFPGRAVRAAASHAPGARVGAVTSRPRRRAAGLAAPDPALALVATLEAGLESPWRTGPGTGRASWR